ncbi:hypothetical protein CHH83_02265 [Bacillus sp. 7586-K]|nr:hypothetical protein CHH83_02265 [Bacillus sp. 7586-K]
MQSYDFDCISDIHLDFYVKVNDPEKKIRKNIKEFVKTMLPEQPKSILIIAGDLGHYNHQNKWLIEELKKYYSFILLVAGNHDYYLISSNISKKYNSNSLKRIEEMKSICNQIEGVYYLDGNIVEIDGIKYGGVGMWYDYSYSSKVFGKSKDSTYDLWKEVMNDSKLIKGMGSFYQLEFFNSEKEKLDNILDKIDVIITHVGSDWSRISHEYKFDHTTSFYYFDGEEFLNRVEDKVWIFGHTHERYDYELFGCRFINCSLGYPSERKNRKIVNIIK